MKEAKVNKDVDKAVGIKFGRHTDTTYLFCVLSMSCQAKAEKLMRGQPRLSAFGCDSAMHFTNTPSEPMQAIH